VPKSETVPRTMGPGVEARAKFVDGGELSNPAHIQTFQGAEIKHTRSLCMRGAYNNLCMRGTHTLLEHCELIPTFVTPTPVFFSYACARR
jgi:hypothetical protein